MYRPNRVGPWLNAGNTEVPGGILFPTGRSADPLIFPRNSYNLVSTLPSSRLCVTRYISGPIRGVDVESRQAFAIVAVMSAHQSTDSYFYVYHMTSVGSFETHFSVIPFFGTQPASPQASVTVSTVLPIGGMSGSSVSGSASVDSAGQFYYQSAGAGVFPVFGFLVYNTSGITASIQTGGIYSFNIFRYESDVHVFDPNV